MKQPSSPKSFAAMSCAGLRQFINGCHRRRDYDAQFEAACRELNSRTDANYYVHSDEPSEVPA